MTAYRACRTSTTRNPQSLCLATYTGQFPTLSKAYMKLIDDSVRMACMELTDDSVRMALSKQSAMWQKCLKKKITFDNQLEQKLVELLPHSSRFDSDLGCCLCGVCEFPLQSCGFPLDALVSAHIPKICSSVGSLASVNSPSCVRSG